MDGHVEIDARRSSTQEHQITVAHTHIQKSMDSIDALLLNILNKPDRGIKTVNTQIMYAIFSPLDSCFSVENGEHTIYIRRIYCHSFDRTQTE